jgi:flagellar protein FlaG
MGMDKINNIKAAVASATLNQNSAKGSKPLAHSTASNDKGSVNAPPSRLKTIIPPLSKSSISNKTLAETLKTNEEKVRAAVKEINNELVKLQSELGFSVDKVANDVVVTVKRKESGEIVRQIPSETALKLAHNFEKLKGVLLDEKF